MTADELLKPRCKVIADYPGSPHCIGDILPGGVNMVKNYPHLFQALQWWQDRAPEDMPEYVKLDPDYTIGGDRIFRVIGVHKYADGELGLELDDEENQTLACRYLLPASFEEYEAYTNKQNS